MMPHLVGDLVIGTRPASIDACFKSWRNNDQPAVIRSAMESGAVKVRRRSTAVRQLAQVECNYRPALYPDWLVWFRDECQAGVLPTEVSPPWGGIEIWRFTGAPQFDWFGAKAFRVTVGLERDPRWP